MNSQLPDPPKSIIRFLKFICPSHLFEEIEGDLIQRFFRDVRHYGEAKGAPKNDLEFDTILSAWNYTQK